MNIKKLLLHCVMIVSFAVPFAAMAAEQPPSVAATANSTQLAQDNLININTANAAELATIKGLGASKAASIVKYRQQNGQFDSLDDLDNVPGIGDKLLAKIRSQLTIG